MSRKLSTSRLDVKHSEVGNILNELLMKHGDDLGGRVGIAIHDADKAASELERLAQHRCQWCGHTWTRDSNLYDECGDCYREHQRLRAVAHEVLQSAVYATNGADTYTISGTTYATVQEALGVR